MYLSAKYSIMHLKIGDDNMKIFVGFDTPEEKETYDKYLSKSFKFSFKEKNVAGVGVLIKKKFLYEYTLEPYISSGRSPKLTKKQITEMAWKHGKGKSYDELAKEYGVSRRTVIYKIKEFNEGE